MLLLAVDRSSTCSGAALFRDSVCLGACSAEGEPARSPAWMAELRDLLARTGVKVRDLDLLAVGLGPGSFSGTRAAVAGVQGLGLPYGIPLAGVSSAAAVAFSRMRADSEISRVTVVGDARRERLWVAAYVRAADGRLAVLNADGQPVRPTHTSEDFALVPRSALSGSVPEGSVVITPDWDRLGAYLAGQFSAGRLIAGACRPTAPDVAHLVCADPAAARAEPVPIYLHPPVAAVTGRQQ